MFVAERSLQFRGRHSALCGSNCEGVPKGLGAYLPLDACPQSCFPHDALNRSGRQTE
jgi:hypothetical protein